MRVLVFRLFGDFAHFRKFYTTSSPLSFSFPPIPTVRGIIGAIMGYDKNEYLEKTRHLKIGVGIVNPIKKVRMGLNIIFTKGGSGGFDPTLISHRKGDVNKTLRTQIKSEFVKDTCYKVYIGANDEFLENLENILSHHQTYYSVSLGLSELLGDFSFEGVYKAEAVEENDATIVHSVIPAGIIKSLDVEKIRHLAKERIPIYMLPNRKVQRYEDVVFDVYGNPIYGKFSEVLRLENDEYVYLW
ncbi:type I-B CRISPR-associated protein Cas5b [Hydrogenobaculum acidophilum]